MTSPATSRLVSSSLLWPAPSLSEVTEWLVVNPKSELRPQDVHTWFFPLKHTACHRHKIGVRPKVLLSCIAVALALLTTNINFNPIKSHKYIIKTESYRPVVIINIDSRILRKVIAIRKQQHIKSIMHNKQMSLHQKFYTMVIQHTKTKKCNTTIIVLNKNI